MQRRGDIKKNVKKNSVQFVNLKITLTVCKVRVVIILFPMDLVFPRLHGVPLVDVIKRLEKGGLSLNDQSRGYRRCIESNRYNPRGKRCHFKWKNRNSV